MTFPEISYLGCVMGEHCEKATDIVPQHGNCFGLFSTWVVTVQPELAEEAQPGRDFNSNGLLSCRGRQRPDTRFMVCGTQLLRYGVANNMAQAWPGIHLYHGLSSGAASSHQLRERLDG